VDKRQVELAPKLSADVHLNDVVMEAIDPSFQLVPFRFFMGEI
jgi:hypothetical protein